MMPFVMDEKTSLPKELHGYWSIIESCVKTLHESDQAPRRSQRVGYLTVHESLVKQGNAQRRPGLHTEGFTRAPYDSGKVLELPRWHPWGFGFAMRNGEFEGGIFMASTVSDSCHVYNVIVPPELVGRGGDVEHLRTVLAEQFPAPPAPRTRYPNDPHRYGDHAGCARCDAHVEWNSKPVIRPVSLQAGELVWFTDRTPHESLSLHTRQPQPRQFFRLVTGGIDTWYAAHSTPNPLGTRPQATVVDYDKFTGERPATSGEANTPATTDADPRAQAPPVASGGEKTTKCMESGARFSCGEMSTALEEAAAVH